MKHLIKLFWTSLLFFALASCDVFIHDPYEGIPTEACEGGCEYSFKINPEQQPDAYLDGSGYWHVYTGGLRYFQIIGELEEPHEYFHINGIPDVSTSMDSDYWVTFGNISFTTPMYGVLGWYSDAGMNSPLPIGDTTYTINELILNDQSITNLVGYEITPYTCLDCPYSSSLFGVYSRYNPHPTFNIFNLGELKGDTAIFFIEVEYASEWRGSSNPNSSQAHIKSNTEIKVIFE
jgi:hypothetical protein